MSKRVGGSPRTIQNVFVLLLLSLFACLATFLVTMGAQAYRSAVERADENNNTRIMTAVVRSAVWAEDGGEVSVETYPESGITALCIAEEYDGDRYIKRLYCVDGYLYESFMSEENPFNPEYGEDLCALRDFVPSISGKRLTVRLTSVDGIEREIRMYLRAGGAEK